LGDALDNFVAAESTFYKAVAVAPVILN